MGNLFGVRRRAPIVTAQDKAILQLKQQRDKIKIYQKKTEAEVESSKQLATKLFQNGMKDRALVLLRRKKCMEAIIDRTDKQLETLEQLVSDIEFTQVQVSVVEGLKIGSEALKELTSLMNIDDIQRMMEDNQEAAEKQKQISDILQRSAERFDESELLEELDNLVEKPKSEAVQDQPLDKIDTLPAVPSHEPEPVPDNSIEDAGEEEKSDTAKKEKTDLLVAA